MGPFYGNYSCKVDDKGRFSIPARFRREFGIEGGESFVVTKGPDGCLLLYAPEGWRAFQEKLMSLPAGPDKKDAIRYFSSNSRLLSLDKQGRVGIPKEYLAQFGIDHEAALVGLLDHIEVWNPESFEQRLSGAEEIARKMEQLL